MEEGVFTRTSDTKLTGFDGWSVEEAFECKPETFEEFEQKDDEKEICMMEGEVEVDFVEMDPTNSASAAGVFAATAAVCATCRFMVGKCECKPRGTQEVQG